MEREHKNPFIPVHVEVVINYLPLIIGEQENIPCISVFQSFCAKENHFDWHLALFSIYPSRGY